MGDYRIERIQLNCYYAASGHNIGVHFCTVIVWLNFKFDRILNGCGNNCTNFIDMCPLTEY